MTLSMKGIASLALGIWLMASPWVLGFSAAEPAAMWTALLAGISLAALGMMQFDSHDGLLYWVMVALGVAIAFSPFVFGFADHGGAMVNKIAAALVVAGVALSAIFATRHSGGGPTSA
jgi:hypothetical protein